LFLLKRDDAAPLSLLDSPAFFGKCSSTTT
jgi:hypothetical protein